MVQRCVAGGRSEALGCLPPGESVQQGNRRAQHAPLSWTQAVHVGGQGCDPSLPARVQKGTTFDRRLDAHHALVGWVRDAPYEALLLERGDEPRHRGDAHLLCGGERPDRHRPAEDDHRQGREARGAEPRRVVLTPESAQEMDRRRVQAIGDRGGGAGAGSAPARLTGCHDPIC